MKNAHSFLTFRPLLAAASLLLAWSPGFAGSSDAFSDWPTGADPEVVGERLIGFWISHELEYRRKPTREYVIYPEVCAWYGALSVAAQIEAGGLTGSLVRKFQPLQGEDSHRISPEAHVDYRMFGALPLEIHRHTGDPAMRELGLDLADAQWENAGDDGITHEARYWIDDMYMIPILQVQAYRVTGDEKYLDRAARTMVSYLERLQQPNGLFHHAPDSPFYWGRGNGWVAAGAAELLRELPESHPNHEAIVAAMQRMCESILRYQGEEGLWRQLVDDPESWPETSSSGMFAFTFVSGIKDGWLSEERYAPAARKAWIALCARLDENALVSDVCVGTNKAARVVGPDFEAQRRFYMERPRSQGDLHGQAPLLWTASALLR